MEKHISTEAAPIEIADPASSIDNRLSELYGEAVGASTSEAIPVVRTTLSNLVVYCSDSREADVAASDAAAVVGMHPCRAIIVSPAVESAEGP